MPFLELFDETLDINSTGSYTLSLQASYDELSFCLFDTPRNKFIMLRSYAPDENNRYNHEQVSEIIERDDFLTKKYYRINLVMPSAEFTLVPVPLYDPGRKDEYFCFNHGNPENKIILSNKLTDNDSYLIFAVSKPLLDVIKNFFPSIFPSHHLRPLFGQMVHAMKTVPGDYFHLHIENDFFNIVLFRDLSLKYINAFKYRNISDIVYFVLNVFKNIGIQGEGPIYLSGLTERYDDLTSTLALYIRNIVFAVPSGNFTFSYVFNDTPLHRFINLYTILNCE